MPFVSVVVVTWNGAGVLPRCLQSLRAQTYQDFELILVDNASSDGSTIGLEERFPDIHIIRLDRNHHFAAANNLAARQASGEWLALLNNDAFPAPDWLEKLLAAAKENPEYTFFAPRMTQALDPRRIDGTGDVYHVSGLAWRRDYNRPAAEVQRPPGEIFSPSAAAALYQLQPFLQVGGFDESYTSYHEDIDLGYRLRLRGHRCMYVPDAVVEHIGSASYGKDSAANIYYMHRNFIWTFFTNTPSELLWRHLAAHLVANLFFLIFYSLRGQPGAIWKAKVDALRGLPAAWRKRKERQGNRTIQARELADLMDHGWFSPYLLGSQGERMRRWASKIGLGRSTR